MTVPASFGKSVNLRLSAIAAALQEALVNETRLSGTAPEALDVGQPPAAELPQGDGLRIKSLWADVLAGDPHYREAAPQFKLTSYLTSMYGATRLVAALRRIV